MSETWSETRDANTCLVGSGPVRSGSARVRLVEFGLLNRQVYDQTKSADLSDTRADPIRLCRRPGRRPGSPTKSGRARLVEFGLLDLNSTTRARPDFVVDFPRKTPTFLKMAWRQRNCCRFFNYTSMQLRGCEFITEEEKTTLRVGEKVHPWERIMLGSFCT